MVDGWRQVDEVPYPFRVKGKGHLPLFVFKFVAITVGFGSLSLWNLVLFVIWILSLWNHVQNIFPFLLMVHLH
jgi:hypothetical protein